MREQANGKLLTESITPLFDYVLLIRYLDEIREASQLRQVNLFEDGVTVTVSR